MFEHQRLRVFDAAQRLLAELTILKSRSKAGYSNLWRHVFEAAESIALNIGEACGDGRPGKKANFLRIACGSAGECVAAIQSLIREGAVSRNDCFKAFDLLHCITGMLVGLITRYDAAAKYLRS